MPGKHGHGFRAVDRAAAAEADHAIVRPLAQRRHRPLDGGDIRLGHGVGEKPRLHSRTNDRIHQRLRHAAFHQKAVAHDERPGQPKLPQHIRQ